MKKIIIILVCLFVLIVISFSWFSYLFDAPQSRAESEQFTVQIGKDDSREVGLQLKQQGFIKSRMAFNIAFFGLIDMNSICVDCIFPGAYQLSKAMNVRQIVRILKQEPYMKWVIIPEGWRKEQIAERLANIFNWSVEEKSKWVIDYTAMEYDYVEGVYFPDTYLIPTEETPYEVAKRLQAKFEEQFAPYAKEALEQNIKWDTVLKIASLIQRETNNPEDMPIIAGVIWNRLEQGMKLQIDATLQYVKASTLAYTDLCKLPGQGEETTLQCDCDVETDNCYQRSGYYTGVDTWWGRVDPADKQIDSPYNTYLHTGLPPHPIVNPGLSAIIAVLHPAETDCLFYLHSADGTMYCSKTYDDHLENIDLYLRNNNSSSEVSNDDIVKAFLDKYPDWNRPGYFSIDIKEALPVHARGTVSWPGNDRQGRWFATKLTDKWLITDYTGGDYFGMCENFMEYQFPEEMTPDCWDNTKKVIINTPNPGKFYHGLTLGDKSKIIQAFLEYMGNDSNFVDKDLYVKFDEYIDGYLTGMIVIGGIDNYSTPYFLAAKNGNDWKVLYWGQEAPSCENLEGYNVPIKLAPSCWTNNGTELIER